MKDDGAINVTIKNALHEAVKSGPPQSTNAHSIALKGAIDENRDLVTKAIEQGYSPTGLAKRLKAAGVSASIETLRRHVKTIVGTEKPKRGKIAPKSATAKSRHIDRKKDENSAFTAEERTT